MIGSVLIVIALLTVGMVLLVAEVAVIPGFGVAGVSAAALIIGGVAFAWTQFGPAWGVGSLLISGAATLGVLLWVPRTRAGKALVLADSLKNTVSADAGLVGQEGTAQTPLRPAGVIELGGRRVDVVTDGEFVEAGRAVRVVSVEGARVVVAPIK
jgi:membrane-bound serine protease (ClpP class)